MSPAGLRLGLYVKRGGFFVLLFASVLNAGWAALFLASGRRLVTVSTAYLLALVGVKSAATVLLAVAAMALAGLRVPNAARGGWWPRWGGLILTLPQMFVLFMAASSAVASALLGRYPDGTVPGSPHYFIATDQLLTVLFALLHAVSVSLYYGRRWTLSA